LANPDKPTTGVISPKIRKQTGDNVTVLARRRPGQWFHAGSTPTTVSRLKISVGLCFYPPDGAVNTLDNGAAIQCSHATYDDMDQGQLFCPDWYGRLSVGIYAGPYLRIPTLAATRKTRLKRRTGRISGFFRRNGVDQKNPEHKALKGFTNTKNHAFFHLIDSFNEFSTSTYTAYLESLK